MALNEKKNSVLSTRWQIKNKLPQKFLLINVFSVSEKEKKSTRVVHITLSESNRFTK